MAAQRQFVEGNGIAAAKSHVPIHRDCCISGEHHIVGERKGFTRFRRTAVHKRGELSGIGQCDGIVSKGAEGGCTAHHRAATQRSAGNGLQDAAQHENAASEGIVCRRCSAGETQGECRIGPFLHQSSSAGNQASRVGRCFARERDARVCRVEHRVACGPEVDGAVDC